MCANPFMYGWFSGFFSAVIVALGLMAWGAWLDWRAAETYKTPAGDGDSE
jgi:hypothetical protein